MSAILKIKINGVWTEIPALKGPRGPVGPQGPAGVNSHDFTHTSNTTASGSATVSFAPNERGSAMLTTSADLSIALIVGNTSDNYLWIRNTGNSEIDITISSVRASNAEAALSNVYVPSDGITVPSGGVCELGVIRNNDGVFITSRNDLSL